MATAKYSPTAGDMDGDLAIMAIYEQAQSKLFEAERRTARQQPRIEALEQAGGIDALTGLLNEDGFLGVMRRETGRIGGKMGGGGLLVMIDLDNFGAIIARHGAEAGDAAIRLVARMIGCNCRPADACARLRDDEFIMLLVDTTREQMLGRAQNLIRELNGLSLAWEGDALSIRASLCLKDFGPDDGASQALTARDGWDSAKAAAAQTGGARAAH